MDSIYLLPLEHKKQNTIILAAVKPISITNKSFTEIKEFACDASLFFMYRGDITQMEKKREKKTKLPWLVEQQNPHT